MSEDQKPAPANENGKGTRWLGYAGYAIAFILVYVVAMVIHHG